ncbi:MAG TPA: TolC family protein [Candidatus Obscuribacterales bacterium]
MSLSLLTFTVVSGGASRAAEQPAAVQLKPEVLNTKRLTIEQAISGAMSNYPQIVQRLEEVQAAKSGVTLQKMREYVPQGLSTWESVAASHNKLTQILFGNPVLVANPGPGLDPEHQTMHGTFYNGSGFLFDWSGIDFGLHKARITEARANVVQAQAHLGVTQLDVAESAALAFLNVVTGQEQLRAQQANVHRMEIVRDIVRGLVLSGLRPGVDLSIAEAQLAQARNGEIEARQQLSIANARLALAVGEPGLNIEVDPAPVEKETRPVLTVTLNDFSAHPLALAQRSAIGILQAHSRVVSKSSYPEIHWLGGMNFRGSGLDIHGHWQAKDAYGWLPNVTNWNVGMMVNWDFLAWVKNNQEVRVLRHRVAAEQAGYRQIVQNLVAQNREARAMVEGAVALAQNTVIQVQAASEAELRARTRYESGLANIAEVAQAERLLTEAQVQMSVARVRVWSSLLAVSNSRGDIKPFLNQIATARQQGM